MNELIKKLIDRGLKYDDETNKIKQKIKKELNDIGFLKLKELLKYKKTIKEIIDLFILDRKISLFFFKNLRRIETTIISKITNFFSLEKNPKVFLVKKKIENLFFEKYIEGDEERLLEKKTKKLINILQNVKKSNSTICEVIHSLTLGKLFDLYELFNGSTQEKIQLDSYIEFKKLIQLRNKISHSHILLKYFNKNELKGFWEIIKTMPFNQEKINKNEKVLYKYLEEYEV